jgi:hypothetical protein
MALRARYGSRDEPASSATTTTRHRTAIPAIAATATARKSLPRQSGHAIDVPRNRKSSSRRPSSKSARRTSAACHARCFTTNMRTVVVERNAHGQGKHRFHPGSLDAGQALRFSCHVYARRIGTDQGKVERFIGSICVAVFTSPWPVGFPGIRPSMATISIAVGAPRQHLLELVHWPLSSVART